VTAQFAPGELWGTWCALQPKSYPVVSGFGASSDTCAPGDAPVTTQFPSATPVKGDLCLTASVCLCADDACRPNLDRFRWSLDIQLRDGLYEGEVYSDANVGGGAWLPGIRLRRVKD
jgi:hypothetical protein